MIISQLSNPWISGESNLFPWSGTNRCTATCVGADSFGRMLEKMVPGIQRTAALV